MKKFSKVLVLVLAFVSFATIQSKAQTNRESACSASGWFGECTVSCVPSKSAKCSGGFFASCSCEGVYYLNKIVPNQDNIKEFTELVNSFESSQGQKSKQLFLKTLELMKGTDGQTYSESSNNFTESLSSLPKSEKAMVDAWVTKKSQK